MEHYVAIYLDVPQKYGQQKNLKKVNQKTTQYDSTYTKYKMKL